MKAGLLVALLLSAVLLIGGCAQEKEAGTLEESREGATEETTAEPTTAERTIIKETTVVVPAPAPSPAQALSPSPESQQAAGPESVAPEVEIHPR
jgi:PBP1b-binding outer membrane lipoprotein LpoB